MVTLSVISILLLFSFTSAGKNDVYEGFTVHGIKLREQSEVTILREVVAILDLDVWSHGAVGLRDAVVMVSKENESKLLDYLDENGIHHYVHLADVVKALDEHDEAVSNWKRRRNGKMVPFEDYPTYEEVKFILTLVVNDYMERLATKYPNLVTLVNAGPSFEGRDVKYLKISTTNFTDSSKPIYFMDATMHSREWVTTPVTLYAMHRLLEDLRSDEHDLLETVDWIIMPIVNPDGYVYTHTDERLWRRTRSYRPEISTCYGVDANRNFNISFNTIGVSSNPCSDIYPGPAPFSEIEAVYIRDIVFEHLDRIQVYLNIHSYGNFILFGFDDLTLPPNAVELHYVGAVMGAAIDTVKLPIAPHYLVGNSAYLLYPVSGSAQDYVQYVGVPYAYTLELPEFLRYDFRVPPEYIEQINIETWRGIAASARASTLFYTRRHNSV
ncbi:PREDICTED: carboxypeptidase B-like [Papilio polytes]|uniref:carboxypeptidase B-like n=1 Tax=Papilio polytes TaxID=76194 RepID=UPI000675CE39|nr:PREDICTED: carboxypeptidase B-like [Papilio polytes]